MSDACKDKLKQAFPRTEERAIIYVYVGGRRIENTFEDPACATDEKFAAALRVICMSSGGMLQQQARLDSDRLFSKTAISSMIGRASALTTY